MIQIKRFSPHQTAKVFAILMAVSMLTIMIPFGLMVSLIPDPVGPDGNPVQMGFPFGMMFVVMPVFQAVFGYLMIVFGCWVYNKLFGKIGGFEFEFEEKSV